MPCTTLSLQGYFHLLQLQLYLVFFYIRSTINLSMKTNYGNIDKTCLKMTETVKSPVVISGLIYDFCNSIFL